MLDEVFEIIGPRRRLGDLAIAHFGSGEGRM
jgi:hypothetical protein